MHSTFYLWLYGITFLYKNVGNLVHGTAEPPGTRWVIS